MSESKNFHVSGHKSPQCVQVHTFIPSVHTMRGGEIIFSKNLLSSIQWSKYTHCVCMYVTIIIEEKRSYIGGEQGVYGRGWREGREGRDDVITFQF